MSVWDVMRIYFSLYVRCCKSLILYVHVLIYFILSAYVHVLIILWKILEAEFEICDILLLVLKIMMWLKNYMWYLLVIWVLWTFLQGRFFLRRLKKRLCVVYLLCLDCAQVVLAKNFPKGEIDGYLYVGFNFA